MRLANKEGVNTFHVFNRGQINNGKINDWFVTQAVGM